MGRAIRVCAEPGCPALTRTGRCFDHTRTLDRARGTRQQRGYDATHDRLRNAWAARIPAGHVLCWRCLEPIAPGEPWDLGHDDTDRSTHRGPEHASCNRSAAGRASHT